MQCKRIGSVYFHCSRTRVHQTECGEIVVCNGVFYSGDICNQMRPSERERIGLLETSVLFLTFVDQKSNEVCMHRRDCCLQHHFLFNYIMFHSRDIYDHVVKLSKICPNILCFWAANFWEEGPKFLTQFYKFRSPLNMCQNLLMIDRVTSEIRR